jgi:putative transcriptional regulator
MKRKEIAFDPESLVASVESVAAHAAAGKQQALRTTVVPVFRPAPELSPGQIQALRHRLGISQSAFASMLNVPLVTAISWEKGRRSPSGAALRLLEVARKHPEVLTAAGK